MKRTRKLLSLLLALMLALTACSSGGKRETRRIDWIDAPAYLTEDVSLPVTDGDLIGCCTDGETMFILADTRTEEGEICSILCRAALSDGTAAVLEEYEPPALPETAVVNRFGPVLAPDGMLWVYETWTVPRYDLPADFQEASDDKSAYYTGTDEFHHLRQLDPATGRQKKLVDLSEAVMALEEDALFSTASFAVDGKGNIYFARTGGVVVLNQRGNLQFTLQADLPRSSVYNAAGGNLVLLPDGSVAALTVRPGGMREVRSIDPDARDWGALRCEIAGTDQLCGGTGGFRFFYTSGSILYGWPEEGKEGRALLDWAGMQLDGSVMCFAPMDGGQMAALVLGYSDGTGDWYANTIRLALCSPTDEAPEDGRITLIYGAICESEWDLSQLEAHIRIVNKRNPQYYIQVRNYGGVGDYSAALTRLSADVMSGRCPDLWDESLPIDLYARKGYLEDLWPWIDGDEELGGREALMTRVLDAASVDGKLYKVGRTFSIQTLVGCAGVLGGRTAWTMEELLSLYRTLPKGSALLNTPYNNCREGLAVFLTMNENRWVDWSSGACYFDTDEFKSVLELCAGLGGEQEEAQLLGRTSPFDPDGGEALRAEQQLLSVAVLEDPKDILYYEALCGGPEVLSDFKAMLNGIGVVGNRYRDGVIVYPDAPAVYPSTLGQEDRARESGMLGSRPLANDVRFGRLEGGGYVSYIGYPTSKGTGSAFRLENCAAMSASSAHKEGAWNFIRSMLRPGGTKSVVEDSRVYGFWGFPISKPDFDAAMRPEISWLTNDFTGEYLLDPDGNRIELPVRDKRFIGNFPFTAYETPVSIGLPIKLVVYPLALREEQVEHFMALYDAIDRTAGSSGELLDIVLEQAGPYFAGDRSLDETARLIQSRATLYVNENR